MNSALLPGLPEAASGAAFHGSGPYTLDYLDVAAKPSHPRGTRVVALGGKGENEFAALRRWLAPELEVVLSAEDDSGAGGPESGLDGVDRLFILAGLGGRRGTARALNLAYAARDRGIPAFALVSLPFAFEATERIEHANAAKQELEQNTAACLAFQNQDLIEIFGGESGLADAFAAHTRWLAHAISTFDGLTGTERLQTFLAGDGPCRNLRMGFGKASGADQTHKALSAALGNPLLRSMHGTRALLVLCSGNRPSEEEIRQAETLAKEMLTSNREVTSHAWSDPRMGEDCHATLLLRE